MRAHKCDQTKRRRLEFGSTGHCGWRGSYLGLACVPSSDFDPCHSVSNRHDNQFLG